MLQQLTMAILAMTDDNVFANRALSLAAQLRQVSFRHIRQQYHRAHY